MSIGRVLCVTRLGIGLAIGLGIGLGIVGPAWALPDQFAQEGLLIDRDGRPLEGAHTIHVRLWDAAEGGNLLLDEAHENIQLVEGYYVVYVGSVRHIAPQLFYHDVFVGISIDGGVELQPRLPLAKVPGAFVADVALNVVGEIHPSSVSIGNQLVIDAMGRWVGDPAGLRGEAGPDGPRGPPGPPGPAGGNGSPDTPAQVLAKLLTVDGAGSGLNADLLDGVEGADYLRRGEDIDATTFRGHPLDAFVRTPAHVLERLRTVDGAGSGVDADRLDGIDSTRFVRTGEQVRDLLVEVDGAASGIDADRLDGLDSSVFMRADQDTATVGALRVGHALTAETLHVSGNTSIFDGIVGIGTDDPQAELHVAGNLRVDGVIEGQNLPRLDDGPMLNLGFDEADGNATLDVSGRGHPGRFEGDPSPERVAGVAGRGLRFNGRNRVTVTDHADFHPDRALTLMAWVRPTACQGSRYGGIITRGDHDRYYHYMLRTSERATCTVGAGIHMRDNALPQVFAPNGSVPDNVWSHVASVWDGQVLRVYVNGVERAATAAAGQSQTGPRLDVHVGQMASNNASVYGFVGDIDHPRVFLRALSAANVMADYSHGRSGFVQPSAGEPGACDAASIGRIYYDVEAGEFRGCDGEHWVVLNGGGDGGGGAPNVGLTCASLKAENPALQNGVYRIDPDGNGPIAPFQVFCDMQSDGGGWTKVLHYENVSYTPNNGAVGNIATPDIAGFAKLSDAQINAVGGAGAERYFKISGSDSQRNAYIRTSHAFNDRGRGLGLAGAIQGCEQPEISQCGWRGINHATIDTLSWGLVGNNCDRYFTDYGSTPQCYNPRDNGRRCFNSGSSCGNHRRIRTIAIWVREVNVQRPNIHLSCADVKRRIPDAPSDVYRIDPDAEGGGAPFEVFCDMQSDGGGWTKILQYSDSAWTPNRGSVGNIAVPNIPGFAKLADAQINAIGGPGELKIYRIVGTRTEKRVYARTTNQFDDSAGGMGLTAGQIDGCEQNSIGQCGWVNVRWRTIDTLYWHVAGDNCDRYFADHNGAILCYNPRDNRRRCFDAGASCGRYPRIDNLSIWVREVNVGGASARSCKDAKRRNAAARNGVYRIDPDGAGGVAPFQVYCEMEGDGGGWAKIVQYANDSYTPTPNASGNIAVANIPGFAKLSDDQINAIGGRGARKIYRIRGSDTGRAAYIRTTSVFNDRGRGLGLMTARIDGCEQPSVDRCGWRGINHATIDTLSWGLVGNNCDRYFTDYGHTPQCYNPRDNGRRCFNSGSSCGNHRRIRNINIWVREE